MASQDHEREICRISTSAAADGDDFCNRDRLGGLSDPAGPLVAMSVRELLPTESGARLRSCD